MTVDEQVAALADALPDGLEVLTPSSAEDKDTIVCTQDVVDEHNLTDLSSLFAVADQITLGAPPEFETRTPFGLKGFKDIYDATFKEFVPLGSRPTSRTRCRVARSTAATSSPPTRRSRPTGSWRSRTIRTSVPARRSCR